MPKLPSIEEIQSQIDKNQADLIRIRKSMKRLREAINRVQKHTKVNPDRISALPEIRE